MSTFTSSFGGRLISRACGVRNTVVTMKKMRSRKATSTIGVMSMRMPTRRLGRRKPPLPFLPLGCRWGVSTAPTELHLLHDGSGSPRLLSEEAGLAFEIGLHVEAGRVGRLKRAHHVRHDPVGRVLVHLHDHARRGVGAARVREDAREIG